MCLTLLWPFCDSISVNSNDFCKLASGGCSRRHEPYVVQCGRGICAKKETGCKEFLHVNEQIKVEGLTEFINIMNGRDRNTNSRLKENFFRFKSKIKTCIQTRYELQASDVCVRRGNCLQKQSNSVRSSTFNRNQNGNCPCPSNKEYVCGSQKNYCSLNREACDAFEFIYKNKNSTYRNQMLVLKTCD